MLTHVSSRCYWEVTSDHRWLVPLQKASILSAGLVSSLNETKNTYQNNMRLLQGCTLSLYAHLLACDILQILDQNMLMVINGYLILQSPKSMGNFAWVRITEPGSAFAAAHTEHLEDFPWRYITIFHTSKAKYRGYYIAELRSYVKGKLHPLHSVQRSNSNPLFWLIHLSCSQLPICQYRNCIPKG